MAFVLMEDLSRPNSKRRFLYIGSFRLMRPIWKFARFTYRASRFVVRKTVWVILGDRQAKPSSDAKTVELKREPA
ncbi:MAG: hypothetical protein WCC10_18485 [Tumebacillaceae bacterium]